MKKLRFFVQSSCFQKKLMIEIFATGLKQEVLKEKSVYIWKLRFVIINSSYSVL